MRLLLNTLISALLISLAAEVSRRSVFLATVLISLPLSSMIYLSLLWIDTGDAAKVSSSATGIVLLLVPSLSFFLLLPALLRLGWGYWLSLAVSACALAAVYFVYSAALRRFGVEI
jgi:hypothetical protein